MSEITAESLMRIAREVKFDKQLRPILKKMKQAAMKGEFYVRIPRTTEHIRNHLSGLGFVVADKEYTRPGQEHRYKTYTEVEWPDRYEHSFSEVAASIDIGLKRK